jgi:hypothetical protein
LPGGTEENYKQLNCKSLSHWDLNWTPYPQSEMTACNICLFLAPSIQPELTFFVQCTLVQQWAECSTQDLFSFSVLLYNLLLFKLCSFVLPWRWRQCIPPKD